MIISIIPISLSKNSLFRVVYHFSGVIEIFVHKDVICLLPHCWLLWLLHGWRYVLRRHWWRFTATLFHEGALDQFRLLCVLRPELMVVVVITGEGYFSFFFMFASPQSTCY